MTRLLPPIDAHAHVQVGIDPRELAALDAVVFAMTVERTEWDAALERRDEMTLWGVGCHPGLQAEVNGFSMESFVAAIRASVLVGEVGLDGRSEAPMPQQREVFRQVLEAVSANPRPISIHSRYASSAVLDVLESNPQGGAILHWWRGSASETARALELGCFFSLNGAEARRPRVLEHLPPARVLTETDYPHSLRSDRRAHQPAAVETIELALERSWGLDRQRVREQLWRNLESLFRVTECLNAVPPHLQHELLSRLPA